MCGIAGFVSSNLLDSSFILKKMTDAISHRGPDGEGFYVADNFAFGHRRLAILDLSEDGTQPMDYMERYVITYNGEIYNYLELRIELEEIGYSFKSQTDTEVIMAAFDCWGVDCLNRFNGMWAFVIYDNLSSKIFISRDRFGIKPLYYFKAENLFIFGSEVKAILQHPSVSRSPNENYLNSYLLRGPKEYIKETSFAGIYRFPFASYFYGDQEGLLREKFIKFWDLKVNESTESFSAVKALDYANQYYNLLYDAVKIRLRSDVPIGSAFSGGLDSSSIVYLVNQILGEQKKASTQQLFSSVYHGKGTRGCDESKYINLMARSLGVKSYQIEPKMSDIPSEHEKMIRIMENPPENSCMSGWHVFKLVSSASVKVTLDGQGADEQLAGYLSYYHAYLFALPAREFFHEVKHMIVNNLLNYKNFFSISNMILFAFLAKVKLKFNCGSPPSPLNVQLSQDIMSGFVNLLHYSDRVSMAHSVESRMPFMDYRLVQFLASVPACYKVHNGWLKYLARLAFANKLPSEICWRKDKMGWPIPEKLWLNTGLKKWCNVTIRTYINKAFAIENSLLRLPPSRLKMQIKLRYLNLSVFNKIFFP